MIPRQDFDRLITDLLRSLVREFIQYPEDLTIATCGPQSIVDIVWSGNRADISRMIGEGAATFHHLRVLMHMVGNRHGYEVTLNRVSESNKGKPERYSLKNFGGDWPKGRLLALVERTAVEATMYGQAQVDHSDLNKETSAVIVRIGRFESVRTEECLRTSLQHTFKTIFNANGRLIRLTVDRSLEPEEQQPQRADGRFAPQR